MKSNPEPVAFSGDEKISLKDCYIFRNNLAHKAEVGIATGFSFTEHPNLLVINVEVKGSKKNTLAIGIPMDQAMKLTRHIIIWNEMTCDYDSLRLDVVKAIFDNHIPDLVAAPWTREDVEAVENMEAKDELQEMVKQDLLMIAAVSMEGKEDE